MTTSFEIDIILTNGSNYVWNPVNTFVPLNQTVTSNWYEVIRDDITNVIISKTLVTNPLYTTAITSIESSSLDEDVLIQLSANVGTITGNYTWQSIDDIQMFGIPHNGILDEYLTPSWGQSVRLKTNNFNELDMLNTLKFQSNSQSTINYEVNIEGFNPILNQTITQVYNVTQIVSDNTVLDTISGAITNVGREEQPANEEEEENPPPVNYNSVIEIKSIFDQTYFGRGIRPLNNDGTFNSNYFDGLKYS